MGEFIKKPLPTAEEIHQQGLKLVEEERWEEAHKMFLTAASMGYARAYCAVGIDFLYGEGAPADYKKAFNYFQRAYKGGWEKAANYLGYMYYFAEPFGIERNAKKAVFYLCIGANQGDALSMSLLSKCYYYAYGCQNDEKMQLYWAEKAIDAGDKLAYETLGYHFIDKCLLEDVEAENCEKYLGYARYCLEEYAKDMDTNWEDLLYDADDAEDADEDVKTICEKIRMISPVKPAYIYFEQEQLQERMEEKNEKTKEMKPTGMSAGQANEFYYEQFQPWYKGD